MEKKNINWSELGFGYTPTDYRFMAEWKDGSWDEGALISDSNVTISECAGVLQYAQTCFEGLKAYTQKDGSIVTFRPDLNAERLQRSARRLLIPEISTEMFLRALDETVKANAAWVPPYGTGATLYVRPFLFGSGPILGVAPAPYFQFRLFCSPVGPYFKGGIKPIRICISDYDRAAPHGTGDIKAGLNYAMSLYAGDLAHKNGFSENMFLVEVIERPVPFEEVSEFSEVGVCGTAAVISPVGEIDDHGRKIMVPSGMDQFGPVLGKLRETLTGIQNGDIEAPEGWIRKIC